MNRPAGPTCHSRGILPLTPGGCFSFVFYLLTLYFYFALLNTYLQALGNKAEQ